MKLGFKEIATCIALAGAPVAACSPDTGKTDLLPKRNWIEDTRAQCRAEAKRVAASTTTGMGSIGLHLAAMQDAFDGTLENCLRGTFSNQDNSHSGNGLHSIQ